MTASDLVAAPVRGRRTAGRWGYPAAMLAGVLLGSVLPMVGVPHFYLWDDTVAASVPIWQRISDSLLAGTWPSLQVDMWRGGNFPAEAATGMLNPVILVLAVASTAVNDLAIAAWVFKFPLMLIASMGVYLLARDYGVSRPFSSVAGMVIPLAGFTLWFDASTWVIGLSWFAFYPWVFLTARRLVHDRGGILPAAGAAILCVTVGNPYGVVGVGVAILSVGFEGWLAGARRSLLRLLGAGLVAAMVAVPVYLPFALTASVGYRDAGSLANDDFMRPGINDFLGLSSPSYLPAVPAFGAGHAAFPMAYLAWFVIPLLPWMRLNGAWDLLKSRQGLMASAAAWGLLLTAPAYMSFFRWPYRLLPYFYISILIAWALIASQGFLTRSPARRAVASFGLVLLGAWLSFGEQPTAWSNTAKASAVVMVGVGLSMWVAHRSQGQGGVAVALGVITLVVLGLQLRWYPANYNVADYQPPRDRAALQQRFTSDLTVVQVASYPPPEFASSPELYDDLLFGSMPSLAGRKGPNAYSGVGFTDMDNALCMTYNGYTCRDSLTSLLSETGEAGRTLGELMRVDRLVVSKWDWPELEIPSGWTLTKESPIVRELTRDDPIGLGSGTLSDAGTAEAQTTSTSKAGLSEVLRVSNAGDEGAVLTFARLAWPGYRAQGDGQGSESLALEIRSGPAGLLQVVVPPGFEGNVNLDWTPPGSRPARIALAVGGLLLAALLIEQRRSRRSPSTRSDSRPTADPADPVVAEGLAIPVSEVGESRV